MSPVLGGRGTRLGACRHFGGPLRCGSEFSAHPRPAPSPQRAGGPEPAACATREWASFQPRGGGQFAPEPASGGVVDTSDPCMPATDAGRDHLLRSSPGGAFRAASPVLGTSGVGVQTLSSLSGTATVVSGRRDGFTSVQDAAYPQPEQARSSFRRHRRSGRARSRGPIRNPPGDRTSATPPARHPSAVQWAA